MTLVEHAQVELERAGLFGGDSDYDGELGKAALAIVKVFAAQGHSGMSASMTTSLVTKLMRYEPLTPLTGEDDEWAHPADDTWQNKRYSSVFKDNAGNAYDISAYVMVDRHDGTWTGPRRAITFPYMPRKTLIDIDQHGRVLRDQENGAMYEDVKGLDVWGFCGDDGCECWTGGPKLRLDGDSHLTDDEQANGLDGK